MNVLIATPASKGSTRGNRVTANRYSSLVKKAGHLATTVDSRDLSAISNASSRVLVALHAGHSSRAIRAFKSAKSDGNVILVITGTDLNRDLQRAKDSAVHMRVIRSLRLSERIVVLHPLARRLVPSQFKSKVRVIHQSCEPLPEAAAKRKDCFSVVVSGHLRGVKDPFRAAMAARLLPDHSRIRITHFGRPLTPGMKSRAQRLDMTEHRYNFRGALTRSKALKELTRAHLLVNASSQEGAPMAVIEAVVNRVPVLLSRIDAHIGLMGRNYSGLFEFGASETLAELMSRAESDPEFYRRLGRECEIRKRVFDPAAELDLWSRLLHELE